MVQSYVVLRKVAHLRHTYYPLLLIMICTLDSPVDIMYVDDTFGVGRSDHVRVARDRVVLVSEGVLAPGTSISTEKSVFASSADILGYHVDCLAVTIRPKDRAIDKLFMFYSVLVVPIDNQWCYGSVSLHWSTCTHM